jgi:glycosyltransferase involved in cell wall biosynthesis
VGRRARAARGGGGVLAPAPVAPVAVAAVSSHAKLGGAERYLETLREQLGREWIRAVIALEDGPFAERVGAAVLPTGPGAAAILRSAERLRQRLRRDPPEVVHANGLKAALVSVLATIGTRLPVLWVKHDFSFDGRLAGLVARRCRIVVTVSAAVAETFDPATRERKVRVVHTGIGQLPVDREAGRRLLLESLGPPVPGAVVGLVGRLHPVKGHEELLAAAPAVLRARPGTRLAFIGGEDSSTPAYPAALRRRGAELGLEGVVSFLGHREDAVELLSGCDVAAMPSLRLSEQMGREGFPLTGLELLAIGTPVVAYADGGVPELLGECGVLVPPHDRDALARALVRLLEDDGLRAGLARCGRERVRERFSLAGWVEAMKDAYREAAGR